MSKKSISTPKTQDDQLYNLAYIDPILKIKNRNALKAFQPTCSNCCIILIQVTDFKGIQLRFGNDFSVQLMKRILNKLRLSHSVQEIFLYSENTFAVFLTNTSRPDLDIFLAKLSSELDHPLEIDSTKLTPTIHIGVSKTKDNASFTYERLIFEGETALNKASKRQYSTYTFFSDTLEAELVKSYDLSKAFDKAIQNKEVDLYFQPIVDIFTGELFSFEALSRWTYKGEFVSPEKFIKIAETNNTIYELGLQILDKACAQALEWKKTIADIKVNVNVSLLQLENGNFVKALKEIINKHNYPPSDLVLEITESVYSLSNQTIDKTIYDLHKLGIIFALDDFGSGFSSIQRMKRMPISISKIDHEFTHFIHENIDDTSVISGMISMSHKIGLSVVVEGVENIDQLRILRSRNCKYVQGYYFAKPLCPEDTLDYVRTYDPRGLMDLQIAVDVDKIDKLIVDNIATSDLIGNAVLDTTGVIVSSNRNFNSIIGENPSDLAGESINSFIFKLDDGPIYQSISDVDSTEKSGMIRRKDGTMRYILYHLYSDVEPHSNLSYLRCLIEDITENIDNELRLMRLRQGYKKIFLNAPVIIFTWNKDYKILEWNNTASVILGYKANEVIDQSMFNVLVPESELRSWRRFADLTLTGHEAKATLKVVDALGQIHICECNNELVRSSSNEIDFVITIMKDITETHHAQERSERLRTIIFDQERLAELGHLSTSIAHEINNPLGYMISSSDILKKELADLYEYINVPENSSIKYLKDDIHEILSDFDEGLERIKSIVNNLRSYTWADKSDNFMPVDLNDVIKKVLSIAQNEIRFKCDVCSKLTSIPPIDAIESKISQVVLNLILTASRSIEKRQLDGMGHIEISTTHDETYVYCIIKDDGLGMTEEEQNQLFDTFYSTNPNTYSQGLSLSISKQVIQDIHHGDFSLTSKPDTGSKYIISLPIHQPKIPR